jgi:hypothetical protein
MLLVCLAAFPSGEFELLSKPTGVPLVAFRLKKKTDEDGEQGLAGSGRQNAATTHISMHGWAAHHLAACSFCGAFGSGVCSLCTLVSLLQFEAVMVLAVLEQMLLRSAQLLCCGHASICLHQLHAYV